MKAFALMASIALASSSVALAGFDPAQEITMHMEAVDTPADVLERIQDTAITAETTGFSDEEVDIDQIINIAKKVWTVIEANKPVVNIKYHFANALPQGVTSSAALAGFSDIETRSVRLWGTNGFGITVYDVTLTTVHQYGGNYNGKGKYLETVTILPSNVNVLWGYTVNYTVDNVSVLNGGSSEDPIAMISLQAKFKVETVLQTTEVNTVYQFRGDSPTVKTSGI
jgi:hypothetical protein